jgi:hypothetical protein
VGAGGADKGGEGEVRVGVGEGFGEVVGEESEGGFVFGGGGWEDVVGVQQFVLLSGACVSGFVAGEGLEAMLEGVEQLEAAVEDESFDGAQVAVVLLLHLNIILIHSQGLVYDYY